MKIYTKKGDKGQTTLMSPLSISKSDDRLNAIGTIDELTSNLGLCKAMMLCPEMKANIERIQRNLITIMAGLASSNLQQYVLPQEETEFLEQEIDRAGDEFNSLKEFVLPGGCELSARLDIARTVARRAERMVAEMGRKYPVRAATYRYMNRLSDYIYMLARFIDFQFKNGNISKFAVMPGGVQYVSKVEPTASAPVEGGSGDGVVTEVLQKMGVSVLDLKKATMLIERVEAHARELGKKAVVAVCNSQGNPIAVHVMDDAFLVSYDVAVRKAYTAVSVKMTTMELSKLVQPGQTFYGLQNMEKLATFGGGTPLKVGGTIVGGLGVSGGTGEEDHELCMYGLKAFDDIIKS